MNVFGMIPQQQPPQGDDMDDVKNAVAMLMEQQQAGEPAPRPPTPQESEQLKQAATQVMQAKGTTPKQDDPAALFGKMMGQGAGGFGTAIKPAPQPQQQAPAPSTWEEYGPPLPAGMDAMGSAIPKGPTEADKTAAREQIIRSLAGNLSATSKPMAALQERYPKEVKMIREGTPDQVQDAIGTIQRRMTMQEYDPSSILPRPLQDFGSFLGQIRPGGVTSRHLEGTQDVNKALELLKSSPEPVAKSQASPMPSAPPGTDVDVNKLTDQLATAAQAKAPMEPGSPQHVNHVATTVAPDARKAADAMVNAGANTPEKAEVMIRAKYHDDPELEQAINEAKQTYDQIRKMNNEPPTVVQFIGAILVGLAGGTPEMIHAILNPRAHLNAQREQMAGESLLKLQLAKASGRRHQAEIEAKQGADSIAQKRIDAQLEMAKKREAGLEERSQRQDRMNQIKETIEFYRREAEKHDDAATKSVGESKKKHLKAADEARRAAQPFMQMLNDEIQKGAQRLQKPQQPAGPGSVSVAPQQGQVSPSAMRLLGIGNA